MARLSMWCVLPLWGYYDAVGVTGMPMSVSEWVTGAEIGGVFKGLGCPGKS